MKRIWKEIRKHLFIWALFMKNSLMAQLEYRVNFFTGMAMEIGYLLVKLLYVVVIYNAGVGVSGMSADEVLVFIGTFVIMTAFYTGFFMLNNNALGEYIRKGTLDFFIVKPVSLQFITTLRHTDFALFFTDFTAGVIIVGIGLGRIHTPFNILNLLGFVGYMLSGAMIGYSIFLFPNIFAFWFVKANSLAMVVDSFWDFNNLPMGIYNKTVQHIGVFVLPIFIVTNFPTLFILGKLDPLYAVWGIVAPFIFFALTRVFWKKAVKQYSSASS